LPRPGEAIVATALAGALGVATWACAPLVAFAEVAPFTIVIAVVVAPMAFHWLWRGLPTAANSPERRLPVTPTLRRIGGHGLLHAALAAATIGAVVAIGAPWGDGIVLRAAVGFAVGALLGALAWGPLGALVILGYGLPLRAATGGMDAAYPDVVDRALVRTHRRLALAATLGVVLAGSLRASLGDMFSRRAHLETDLAIELPSVAVFVLLAAAAIAVPARAALRAHRRLEARKTRIGNDLHLVPLPPGTRIRRNQLPILGEATRPTHSLVRVAAAGNYRIAEGADEPVALVALAKDARATDAPAKAR
jgi:hypothetical protein